MHLVKLFFEDDLSKDPYSLTITEDGNSANLTCHYSPLREDLQELRADVSSPIGLFRAKQLNITEKENERLERCLADLLMCFLHPHLREHGTTILIKGPPLSKLIGRIGYRYPRPDLTIAFVTTDTQFFRPPAITPDSDDDWDGPFPDLQEESITRRFYYLRDPQVRVDLFAQGLHRFPANEYINNVPHGVLAKLRTASGSIIEFAKDIQTRQQQQAEPQKANLKRMPVSLFEQDSERLAARNEPVASSGANRVGNLPLSTPSRNAAPALSNEEIFDAIFKNRNSKTGEKQFEELSKFFREGDLGSFHERIDFLRSIKAKSKVFSQRDLANWFSEFDAGRGY
jgi:hypothetical protein